MFSLSKILKKRERKLEVPVIQVAANEAPARKPRLSIVSAIYNMEEYLDAFLESIVKQRAGLDVLEVILVNDGSQDGTQAIMDRWRADYPDLIRTLTIENGGVANARNQGLALAKGQWVTFCDPDDFLSDNYLEETLAEFKRKGGGELVAVSCNFVRFIEERNEFKDDHPLKHRYKARRRIPISRLTTELQLNSNNVWFRTKIIRKAGITFKHDIRPTFEDGFFVSEYFLNCNGAICFLKEPKYFYRKRAAKNSLVDTSSYSRAWYTDQLETGYARLLQMVSETMGEVPLYFQNMMIYEVYWRFKSIMNGSASNLSREDLNLFAEKARHIFSFVNRQHIENFSFGGISESFKVSLCSLLKQEAVSNPKAYLVDYDRLANKARFMIHAPAIADYGIRAFVDGNPVPIEDIKTLRKAVGDLNFHEDVYFWVDLSGGENLSVEAGGYTCLLKKGGAFTLGESILTADVPTHLRKMTRYTPTAEEAAMRKRVTTEEMQRKFKGCIVMMDRDTKADDNAEHLYRYLLRNHMHHKCFFVLRTDSIDWSRLQEEGFKLLAYGSDEHFAALAAANLLVSSHADHYVFAPAGRALADLCTFEFIFLQHGVITADLSKWLNGRTLRGFVTSAPREAASISHPTSPYKFTEREVWLTGLPRHDALLQELATKPKASHTVLIAPTWRHYLTGPIISGFHRHKNPLFLESDYLREWSSVLSDTAFIEEVVARGGHLVFAPHPSMRIYLDDFIIDPRVEVRDVVTTRYSDLVRECQSVLTDFSSLAAEFAYLDKPVTYFHFDRERALSGGHTYVQGYFDYDADGFGPVYRDAGDVKNHVLSLIAGPETPSYSLRRMSFFRHRDGKASQRVAERMFEVAGYRIRPDMSAAQAEALLPILLDEGRTDEAILLSQHMIDSGKSTNPMYRQAILAGLADTDQREFNRRVVEWLTRAMKLEDELRGK